MSKDNSEFSLYKLYESLPDDFKRSHVLKNVSSMDLLRLLLATYSNSKEVTQELIKERQSILIEVFSRHANESDIKVQMRYLTHRDLDLFKTIVSEKDFISALKASMTSSSSNINHKLQILKAWSGENDLPNKRSNNRSINNKQSNHLDKKSKDVDAYIARLFGSNKYESEHALRGLRNFLSTLDFPSMKKFIEPILTLINTTMPPTLALITEFSDQSAHIQSYLPLSLKRVDGVETVWLDGKQKITIETAQEVCEALLLLSKWLKASDAQILIEPILQVLNNRWIEISHVGLKAVRILLPKLKDQSHIQKFIQPVLERLDRVDCMEDAWAALEVLLPKLEDNLDIQKFIEPILKNINLNHNDRHSLSLSQLAYRTLPSLLAKLNKSDARQFTDLLLKDLDIEITDDASMSRRNAAIGSLVIVLPNLDKINAEKLIELLLLLLANRDLYVFQILPMLFSKLRTSDAKKFIKPLLANFDLTLAYFYRKDEPRCLIYPFLYKCGLEALPSLFLRLEESDVLEFTTVLSDYLSVTLLEWNEYSRWRDPDIVDETNLFIHVVGNFLRKVSDIPTIESFALSLLLREKNEEIDIFLDKKVTDILAYLIIADKVTEKFKRSLKSCNCTDSDSRIRDLQILLNQSESLFESQKSSQIDACASPQSAEVSGRANFGVFKQIQKNASADEPIIGDSNSTKKEGPG